MGGDPANTARRQVVLRLEPGELDLAESEALSILLRTELVELGLDLRVERTSESDTAWFTHAREEAPVLLASVDVSATTGWRVFLLDPKGGRGSVRELGADAEGNAAMLEALASVVVSAARALSQADELEAAPLDESVPGRPRESAAVSSVDPGPALDPPVAADPPTAKRWLLHAALGLSSATFARDQPATFGPRLDLGVEHDGAFAVDVDASRHLDAHFATPFGDFALTRSLASLRAGPVLSPGTWTLVPQLCGSVEWLQRGRGQGATDQVATPGRDSLRFGFGGMLGARVRVWGRLAFEAAIDGVFFPQPLRLTADSGRELLAAPWSGRAGAFVGLGVQL
jgi:hypothetical protein